MEIKNSPYKAFLPHLVAVMVFWVITALYFNPIFSGKTVKQNDIMQWTGMSKEVVDYREKNHKEALWTNSMFGGMPAYQISTMYYGNLVRFVDEALRSVLPYPADTFILFLFSFYVLMLVLKIDYRLAIAGSIAFAFATYNIENIEAGHISKANATAYIPLAMAGIIWLFQGNLLGGAALTALGLSLQIGANHLQITYYLFFAILLYLLFEFIQSLRQKTLIAFAKSSAMLGLAALLAVGTNLSALLTTEEYGKYTTRGKSELSEKQGSSGLDKDYALSWSYGVSETLTLLIPNMFGGSSNQELNVNSETYKTLIAQNVPMAQSKSIIKTAPTYWGDLAFTSGPIYAGAIICFLFILGLFILKGPMKWWLVSATVLSMMMSWGRHFPPVTDFLFDYVPFYNKFRTVMMALTIAGFTMPLMAFFTLKEILATESEPQKKELKKKMLLSIYITGGLCLLFSLLPGLFFDYTSSADEQLKSSGFPDWLITAIRADRESLLRTDAFRSLVFILLSGVSIWLYLGKVIKKEYAILALSFLILTDLWMVDKRYLNGDNFVVKKAKQEIQPNNANLQILRDTDPNFRVLNTTVSTFNDATTSYFHKSIGGYHGAKLKRYQELIERHISKNNINVLNMLNTKYVIVKDEKSGEYGAQQNPGALGNAWFVQEYKLVANADSEINALTNFNPSQTAIIDKRFEADLGNVKIVPDSTAQIVLSSYEPNYLVYESKCAGDQLAVFSEIYYDKGWNAYIDGQPAPYVRSNYVLRAMRVPSGNHKIEFKFEPKTYEMGEKISYGSSALLFLLLGLTVFMGLRKKE